MANIPRSEVLGALTQYYEEGDLGFIETVNNITFGYKVQLKQTRSNNLTHQTYEQSTAK